MSCGCAHEAAPAAPAGPEKRRHVVLTNVPPSVMKALVSGGALSAAKTKHPSRFAARHLNAEHGRLQRTLEPFFEAYAAAVDDLLTRHGVYDALPR